MYGPKPAPLLSVCICEATHSQPIGEPIQSRTLPSAIRAISPALASGCNGEATISRV
jgi:hypothetical protein